MPQTANEFIRGRPPLQDPDGRLIVVGPDGVALGGGGGGGDPLSDGTDAGALPTRTLWIAGADGTVLRGVRVDSTGRIRTVVEGTPAVSVSNFPATQPVSGTVAVNNFPGTQPVSGTVTANQGTPNTAANKWPVSVTDGTNTAAVLAAAPGSDTGQSAVAVRVISQLGAGSGGGGGGVAQADKTAFTEGTTSFTPVGGVLNDTITADPAEDQAAAARITPKRAVHSNLRRQDGTEIGTSTTPVRTDPTGTTTQPVSGSVSVSNFPATQPVSGTVTANIPGSATSAVTNVAASATSVTLKASNASRKALYIFNAGTSTLFVKLGATATTTTSYTAQVPPNAFWELPDDPIYTGVVDGIWSATGGNGALVTELT